MDTNGLHPGDGARKIFRLDSFIAGAGPLLRTDRAEDQTLRVDLFLMGMLSLMDAMLEVPIGVVIERLPLDRDVKAQLLCGKTGNRTPLSPIYDLMLSRESGDWESVTKLGKQLKLSLVHVAASYNDAMRWAHQLNSSTRP